MEPPDVRARATVVAVVGPLSAPCPYCPVVPAPVIGALLAEAPSWAGLPAQSLATSRVVDP
jgi:hypothetical protein